MTGDERRATQSLAGIFALRMLGLFLVLPVFMLEAAHYPGGDDPALIGLAMGIYGLTQAVMQMPLGLASDRVGRKKDADYKAQGLGDCIDCKMCVQVCPTGIDIRDGLQIECIGCAACIDACDDIMDKMNYPKGLISYTTEHNLSGQKTRLLRPRLIGYAVALVAMIGLFAWAVANRPLVELDVLKDRVLFRENERGHIENVYTLKIMNKAQRDMTYVITADGLDGLVYEGKREVRALAGEVYSFPVELSIAPEKLPSSTNNIVFHVQSADDPSIKNDADSRFIGPSVR